MSEEYHIFLGSLQVIHTVIFYSNIFALQIGKADLFLLGSNSLQFSLLQFRDSLGLALGRTGRILFYRSFRSSCKVELVFGCIGKYRGKIGRTHNKTNSENVAVQ